MADKNIVNPAVDYLMDQWKKLAEDGASSRHTPTEIADSIRNVCKTTPQRLGVVRNLITNQLKGRGVAAEYKKSAIIVFLF